MLRVVLIHEGVRIPLASGQTLIGRALHCQLRFTDPSVSREHLRLVVSGGRATAENLSHTNGCVINDRPLAGVHALRDGDTVRIGFRRLVVLLERDAAPTCGDAGLSGDSILVDHDVLAGEVTRPGGAPVMLAVAHGTQPLALADGGGPHDRGPAEVLATSYRAREGLAAEVVPSHGSRRAHERFAVEFPVVYRSAALTIDCETRNISLGGVFVASEILDPIGTRCELTLQSEGNSTAELGGVVVRVQTGGAPAQVPGMGVQFTTRAPEAETWLRRASGAAP